MRNFTSYTIATLFAATMLAGPVLANDTGHHTKQADPTYWSQESAQPAAKAPAVSEQVAKEKAPASAPSKLVEGGYRRDRADQAVTANGDVR